MNLDAQGQEMLFPGVERRIKGVPRPVGPDPDPDCTYCGGSGVHVKHSEWCKNEGCECMRMEGECHGRRIKCRCYRLPRPLGPPPQQDMGEPSYDKLIQDIKNNHFNIRSLRYESTRAAVMLAVARCDVRDRKRKGGRIAPGDGRAHAAAAVEALADAAAHLIAFIEEDNASELVDTVADLARMMGKLSLAGAAAGAHPAAVAEVDDA